VIWLFCLAGICVVTVTMVELLPEPVSGLLTDSREAEVAVAPVVNGSDDVLFSVDNEDPYPSELIPEFNATD